MQRGFWELSIMTVILLQALWMVNLVQILKERGLGSATTGNSSYRTQFFEAR
jgi:hypothetical protein